MENAKHTELPWSINNWPQGDAEIRIGAKGTPRIATIHLRDVSINGQKANADFIVRACNNYNNLLRVLKTIAENCDLYETDPETGEILSTLASKAIDKAEKE